MSGTGCGYELRHPLALTANDARLTTRAAMAQVPSADYEGLWPDALSLEVGRNPFERRKRISEKPPAWFPESCLVGRQTGNAGPNGLNTEMGPPTALRNLLGGPGLVCFCTHGCSRRELFGLPASRSRSETDTNRTANCNLLTHLVTRQALHSR